MTGYLRITAKRISRQNKTGGPKSLASVASYITQQVFTDSNGCKVDRRTPGRHENVKFVLFLPPNRQNETLQEFINSVEAAEKRQDAHLANYYIVSIDNRPNEDEQIEIFNNMIMHFKRNLGMFGLIAVHDVDGNNPHAHIVIPSRPIDKDGNFAQKKPHLMRGSAREILIKVRRTAADATNEVLQKHGYNFTVDHRSYRKRDIDKIPKLPIIPYYKTEYSEKARQYNAQIDELNMAWEEERIKLNHGFFVDGITSKEVELLTENIESEKKHKDFLPSWNGFEEVAQGGLQEYELFLLSKKERKRLVSRETGIMKSKRIEKSRPYSQQRENYQNADKNPMPGRNRDDTSDYDY